MATVQIRNLNDEAYGVLKARAAASGRSLQEYLRLLLEREARRHSVAESLNRLRADLAWSEDAITMEEIVAAVREGRDR